MVGKNNQQVVQVKIMAELETLEEIEKLFGSIDNEHSIQICDGKAELKLIAADHTISFDGGMATELLLSFTTGVASGLVANFIYTRICIGINKLEINNQRTRISEESIAQAIEVIKDMISLSGSKDEFKINPNEQDDQNKSAN